MTTAVPFELWREDNVIRLVVSSRGHLGIKEMKELIRLVGALDPSGTVPVVVELDALVQVGVRARLLLARMQPIGQRCVALIALDLSDRVQGEFFRRFHRPGFQFRVFHDHDAALHWLRRSVVALPGPALVRG